MSNTKSNHKTPIQIIGLVLFTIAMAIFTALLGLDSYKISPQSLQTDNEFHKEAIVEAGNKRGLFAKKYDTNFEFIADLKSSILAAQQQLKERAGEKNEGIPANVGEWDYKLGDWKVKEYLLANTKGSSVGPVSSNPFMFWLLTIGLGILGGLLYIIPKFRTIPGIKHNNIYHNPMTRGLKFTPRGIFLTAAILGTITYGFFKFNQNLLWPLLTVAVTGLITFLVFFYEGQAKNNPPKSASPSITAYMGVFTGTYLIGFYVLLYWFPEYITGWILMADPASLAINGNPAGKWFLYGMLYTVVVLVMGFRMMAKYRHNKYQLIRTGSVMFFQTAIAFFLAEILIRLNQPYYDFKNMFPLDYDFFFPSEFGKLINGGGLGMFMFVWGIALFVIGVPLFTYFFGKRWYCSWVCGCGGLAETLGDPYRQLSDKSLRAWKYERWIIHGVLVAAIVMTGMVLYTYYTGSYNIWVFNSDGVKEWYGFLIGAGFSGVVGTGFYPIMGNRVWCRFGCPLAAYLGLVQRFKSRFRITVNGSQCISCGNCSTYCEMGIDVRSYAQKGQDIVRSSCVGCGVCAAVCPRGVLRLENGGDVGQRTEELRTIHITEEQISILS